MLTEQRVGDIVWCDRWTVFKRLIMEATGRYVFRYQRSEMDEVILEKHVHGHDENFQNILA